ncbi:LysR family transcriptional regulator [Zhihengliuella sp.]|uniref:LysR family transcriptional regulator n=1 Tax=Zhihengliuella sp. TaxID=1954483 RepID=UPI002811BA64|nr:LysR family transcriptional regulator [Zhihengliuella sp.]
MVDVLGLRVLVAVADAGSVTGAARELGYSPSNVTQHLRRLERAMDAPMVERSGRRIILTDRAQVLVDRGRHLLLELDDLVDRTALVPSGAIDVGAFPTGLRGLLVPAVATLARDVPALRIRPRELEPDEALDRLRAGRLHAAIVKEWGATRSHEDDVVREQTLGIDPIDAILPAEHALAREPSLTLQDLAEQAWALTPREDPSYRDWFASHQKVLALRPRTIYEASEFASLISFVEHGLAITALPRLGRGPLPTTVVPVPLSDPDAHRTISIATRRTSQSSPNLVSLIAALREQASTALSKG